MLAGSPSIFVLPSILLILGLPIFLVLRGVPRCRAVRRRRADRGDPTYLFGGLDKPAAARRAVLRAGGEIMAQGGIARRVVVWVISVVGAFAARWP